MSDKIVAVSDLHLGAPSSLFSISSVRRKFINKIGQLGDITHFVLLGDILDLTLSPRADAWNKASEFFYELFDKFPKGTQVHYIPGNHDHHLLTLLVEEENIIRPLQKSILDSSSRIGRRPILKPLKLAPKRFGPDDNTFIHALFPDNIRGNLWIEYPHIRLLSQDKRLLFHHGHYFDSRIMPFAFKAAKKYKGDSEEAIEKVEEVNYAFIESLYYFASLGRTSRDFLAKIYQNYQRLVDVLQVVHKKFPSLLIKSNKNSSMERIQKLVNYLYEETSYVLVYGHTHRRDSMHTKANTVAIYNTGGWLVEKCNTKRPEVWPTIFYVNDGNCMLISFEATAKEKQKAAEQARNICPFR